MTDIKAAALPPLPCPFCGSSASLNAAKTHATCESCNSVPWLYVENWNRRAVSAPTAERQSIAEDQKFRELLDEFAYRASERRAMGGDFGSADAEEVAETDLIAHIDTWAARRDS